MSDPVWLLKSAVLAVHGQMIAEYGGAAGIRDEGLLDSALARPIDHHHYTGADIHTLAAVYAGGIVQNHPFVDGNKRTGFIAAYMFLRRNGIKLTADEVSATAMTLALAASEIDELAYAEWLKENSQVARDIVL